MQVSFVFKHIIDCKHGSAFKKHKAILKSNSKSAGLPFRGPFSLVREQVAWRGRGVTGLQGHTSFY